MYVLTLILVVLSAGKVTTIYGGCVTLSLLACTLLYTGGSDVDGSRGAAHVPEIGHRLRPNNNEIYHNHFTYLLE